MYWFFYSSKLSWFEKSLLIGGRPLKSLGAAQVMYLRDMSWAPETLENARCIRRIYSDPSIAMWECDPCCEDMGFQCIGNQINLKSKQAHVG